MNNYEDRTMNHKRVRMDGEGAGVVQGNGLPLNYMDNGHQVYGGGAGGAYGAGAAYYGGEWGEGYGARLPYAPPAHQPYQQPAFLQHQQHLHMGYEPQRHHPLLAQHHAPAHHKWPQPIMQPLQEPPVSALKGAELKQEVKAEPEVPVLPPVQVPPPPQRPMEAEPALVPSQAVSQASGQGAVQEDPPKIKIKTDLFKDEVPAHPATDTAVPPCDRGGGAKGDVEEHKTVGSARAAAPAADKPAEAETEAAGPRPVSAPEDHGAGTGAGAEAALDTGGARVADTGVSADQAGATKAKILGVSVPRSSEDETKIPNDVYFGTPDTSGASTGTGTPGAAPPATPRTPAPPEGKKRGRPKGSTNKPKPPELAAAGKSPSTPTGLGRGQVGRPRGGGHSGSYMRPFKRDFSGIRFRRRWSDDGLDSTHIPNEVYFGDVPVPMEVLYNYYDSHAERDKLQAQQQAAAKATGNVTLVYSSSDSSSDDSSDSDSSDTDPNQDPNQEPKRRPGRPRGSKTVNRRSDGPRTPSIHSGDKPPGITDMKRFLKAAGIQYDYTKLVDGCASNKERVGKLLGLLRDRGLEGEPTLEACRALYSGPAPRRRGPKPGTKRGPRKSKVSASSPAGSDNEKVAEAAAATPPAAERASEKKEEEGSARRVTRGQTSGKPRQRIVISSDEEDAHTPLSKLRTLR